MKVIKAFASSLILLFVITSFSFAQKNEISEAKFKVNSTCHSCKVKIESELSKVDGVSESNLDLETKIVSVKYDKSKTNTNKLENIIADAGYKVSQVNEKKTETNQQGCCKKTCSRKCN